MEWFFNWVTSKQFKDLNQKRIETVQNKDGIIQLSWNGYKLDTKVDKYGNIIYSKFYGYPSIDLLERWYTYGVDKLTHYKDSTGVDISFI